MSQNQDRLLNMQQVRTTLRCSRSHAYNLVRRGYLPSIRIGVRQGLRVRESVLKKFLREREQEGENILV